MNAVMWMIGASVATWAGVAALARGTSASALAYGMIGPLIAASVSWLLIDRAARRDPALVSGVLMQLFPVKMVFFGVYVAVMIRLVHVDPMPFIGSFTAYFVGLYATEAVWIRRVSR